MGSIKHARTGVNGVTVWNADDDWNAAHTVEDDTITEPMLVCINDATDQYLLIWSAVDGKLKWAALTLDQIPDLSSLYSTVGHGHAQLHDRSHSLVSTSDHTSSATSGKMLKADANGLPVDASNTDAEVSAAVTASHAAGHGSAQHDSTVPICVLKWGTAGNTLGTGLTRWLSEAAFMTADNVRYPVPRAGVLKNFFVNMLTNGLTSSTSFTVLVNGSSVGTPTVTFGSGETGVKSDTTTTLAVAAGTGISVEVVTGATGTTISQIAATVEVTAA